jgi:hypothetical protein
LGVVRPDERVDVTLAGAWLAELILLERVDEPDFKLRVIDSTRTGHQDLDFVLQWLADPRRRSLEAWLEIFADAQPRAKVLAGLLDRGLIIKRLGPVPGLARYPAAERETKAALRARLREAVERESLADRRDACLCRLIETAELGTSLWGIHREVMRETCRLSPGSDRSQPNSSSSAASAATLTPSRTTNNDSRARPAPPMTSQTTPPSSRPPRRGDPTAPGSGFSCAPGSKPRPTRSPPAGAARRNPARKPPELTGGLGREHDGVA